MAKLENGIVTPEVGDFVNILSKDRPATATQDTLGKVEEVHAGFNFNDPKCWTFDVSFPDLPLSGKRTYNFNQIAISHKAPSTEATKMAMDKFRQTAEADKARVHSRGPNRLATAVGSISPALGFLLHLMWPFSPMTILILAIPGAIIWEIIKFYKQNKNTIDTVVVTIGILLTIAGVATLGFYLYKKISSAFKNRDEYEINKLLKVATIAAVIISGWVVLWSSILVAIPLAILFAIIIHKIRKTLKDKIHTWATGEVAEVPQKDEAILHDIHKEELAENIANTHYEIKEVTDQELAEIVDSL